MNGTLQRTPLYDVHVAQGAKMVPFAGYEMPLQYADGIMAEHQHTRTHAGLFDVSHMGQVRVRPRSGDVSVAAKALESLVPADIVSIKPGRQRYALFTNEKGGILDDLMVSCMGNWLLVVVNAACKTQDIALMKEGLNDTCIVESMSGRALLALQGPEAGQVMSRLAPETDDMRFMDAREIVLDGARVIISRSGYTGEDGFEIGIEGHDAARIARLLLEQPEVKPIGLGARDSLRLEAGLCLYGSDLDETTTPVEGALEWAIQKSRRAGGSREGGFPGADIILQQFASGAPRRRVGLKAEGRAPIRGGAELFASEDGEQAIGTVTSGVFGPTVGAPVAMGYVDTAHSDPGTVLFANLRGRRVRVTVAEMPFVSSRYKR
ncbi:glycine cleavage system aminomethyltransferase GcvT [Acetobacter sp. AN02]|uniref:glycine cleavage system aminomethyltransferase GcvT n=1 Tax=Acetobacter sp. AN02 TaxID=2894186 RepID=UPI0024343F7C|nr:glycine cleavage system aminomethyltransferase GcvT [Acetobacter sp. AN02]MDG6093614.1 glycine cleavage system aminomethyltransferase GcvT [Acetobacter sp. AN02]